MHCVHVCVRLRLCCAYSRVRVDVGEGVLGLAVLGEDGGHDLKDGGHDVEQLVLGKVLLRKLTLRRVSGVSDAQNCMAVPGNNLHTPHSRHNNMITEETKR